MRTNRGDYLAWLEQHQTEIDEAISDYDVDYEYPKILDWAAAHRNLSLEWVETFVNAEGERSHHPEGGHWSLHWRYGVVGLDSFTREEGELARRAAALFVHLWAKGVAAPVADRCAQAYARNYSITRFGGKPNA